MGTLNVNNINGAQLGGFRNLIINGNFQVNQRGHYSITEETSGTAATGYHYDRWYYNNTDSYLYQGVEDKSVANGTYTLSWAGSGITAWYVVSTDSTAAGTAGDGPDSGLSWTEVSNGGNITVNEGTEYSKHLWVRFSGTLSNLSKVQLEHGKQATPFEHRPYGVELALCQRYYEYADYYYRVSVAGYNYKKYSWKVEKRTTPSVSYTQYENGDSSTNYGVTATTVGFRVNHYSGGGNLGGYGAHIYADAEL